MHASPAAFASPRRPIAVTLGDAAGVGPEIVVKTLADAELAARIDAVVVGPAAVVERACARWAPSLAVRVVRGPGQHAVQPGLLDVIDVGDLPPDLPFGKVNARAGRAAFEAVRHAIGLAMGGEVAAICTAPLHKEALAAAGVPFPGHTEMLAEFAGAPDTAMMLLNTTLRVMLVTVHCSLAEAIRRIDTARELRIIRLAHRTLRSMGIAAPRIAVAGLNPHAGEGGLFGGEEAAAIAPAVAAAREEGIAATGPLPGDTVFMQARRGRFDLVVAQYHDQGLIPIKLLGIEDGVNLTAGLPFVRTSPDHGTAFDIAGQGIADPSSLRAALSMAHALCHRNTTE